MLKQKHRLRKLSSIKIFFFHPPNDDVQSSLL